jgi:hypothetical protein
MYEEGGSRIVIGLAGHAQVGKDTIGQILVRDYGFTRISFADNVREAVYRLNPQLSYDRDVWETQEIVDEYGWEWVKVNVPEARRLLQRMGTEVGREMFGESCWTDMALRQAEGVDRVVFTDVRFANEAQVIRELGGEVWLVTRPGTGPVNDHASDRIDFETDAKIGNAGTVEQLDAMIRGTMAHVYGLSW